MLVVMLSNCLLLQACEAPEQALELVALLVAHWQGTLAAAWPVSVVTALSPQAAINSLPHTLPALMQHKAWQNVAEPCTRRLVDLAVPERSAAAKSLDGSDVHDKAMGNKSQMQKIARIAAACLVAMRRHLARDSWQHMPQVLACHS